MSSGKKFSLVFDTNFIVQKKNLQDVIEEAKDNYTIYVTQVSIDERIGQQSRELKKKYTEIANLQKKYEGIAQIQETTPYEKSAEALEKRVQKAYSKTFGKNIIPFDKGAETFATILHRANHKIPPFIESTSDKGFKDALMWLSMLEYFKTNGEDEVLFMTDDNGFKENTKFLCDEFKAVTGKTIEIKPNTYYKDLLVKKEPPAPPKVEPLPDFLSLREEIHNAIDALRWNVREDYWGEEQWERTFSLHSKVDAKYMEDVFSDLRHIVEEHIFDQVLPASTFLELDFRIEDEDAVQMADIERALKLYEEIRAKYSPYVQQFFTAAANILNQNYKEPVVHKDDQLPF